MNAVLIVIPIIFALTFTIVVAGISPLIGAANSFYSWTQPGSEEQDEEKYLERVSSGAAKLLDADFGSLDSQGPIENKAVILTFDDGAKSQFRFARPILDEFGFNATFFITCNFIQPEDSSNKFHMTWNNVAELYSEGHDIQSHSMTHRNLTSLSEADLEYEVGESKECLREHGVNATVFATPYNEGWRNSTVIESIAANYAFSKNGIEIETPMYLHCDGWDSSVTSQTDCQTYNSQGTLNYANRYSIKAWSHNYFDRVYANNQTKILEAFVKAVEMARPTEDDGRRGSIVVLEYHGITDIYNPSNVTPYFDTDPHVFYAEMKYLHDNGFRVFTMSDIRYDPVAQALFMDDHTGTMS